MSDGYYSSKKTDDVCDDVCGEVRLSFSSEIFGSGSFSVFGNNVFVIGELSNCLLCVFFCAPWISKMCSFVPVIPF